MNNGLKRYASEQYVEDKLQEFKDNFVPESKQEESYTLDILESLGTNPTFSIGENVEVGDTIRFQIVPNGIVALHKLKDGAPSTTTERYTNDSDEIIYIEFVIEPNTMYTLNQSIQSEVFKLKIKSNASLQKDISTKITNPISANVGQTLLVKAVDENGRPTEWECVDPFILTEESTGKKYKLKVTDGKLTMDEVI